MTRDRRDDWGRRPPISGVRRMVGKMGRKQMEEREAAAASLINEARPLLAGKPPEVQGAALSELMATYLLGHHVIGNPRGQTAYRMEVFRHWCALVYELMDHYEEGEEEPTIQ